LLSAVEVRPPLAFVTGMLGRGEWGCEVAGDGKHVTLTMKVRCDCNVIKTPMVVMRQIHVEREKRSSKRNMPSKRI